MLKPRSTRRSNRTPQPSSVTVHTNPAPTVTSRTTRSQSRDLPERTELSIVATRRSVRQGSVESNRSNGSARPPRRLGKKATSGAELSTLEENPLSQPAGSITVQAAASEPMPIKQRNKENLHTSHRISNISGTTAISSTAQYTELIDPDLIPDILRELLSGANRVLELVVPETGDLRHRLNDIRTPGSKWNKTISRRSLAFQQTLEIFLGGLEYVNRDRLLRALFRINSLTTLNDGPWRPDEIFYKANLASIALRILNSHTSRQSRASALSDLHTGFPEYFLTSFSEPDSKSYTGSSTLRDLTFSVALDILTQVTVQLLSKHQQSSNFNPDDHIARMFFMPPAEKTDGLSEYQDSFQNGKLRGLQSTPGEDEDDELSNSFRQQIMQRIDFIRGHFMDGEDAQTSLESLSEEFSWEDFSYSVLEWVRERNHELTNAIKDKGGIEIIADELETKLSQMGSARSSFTSDIKVTPTRQGGKRSDNAPKFFNKDLMQQLKERTRNSGQFARPSEITQENPGEGKDLDAPLDDYILLVEDDIEDAIISYPPEEIEELELDLVQSTAQERLSRIRQMGKENKENRAGKVRNPQNRSFIDRQANAQRVDWSEASTQEEIEANPKVVQISSEPSGKRRREDEDEDDVSEDEGFQEDTTVTNHNARRKDAPVPRRRVPSTPRPESSPNRKRRELSAVIISPRIQPIQEANGYRSVNQIAKARVASQPLVRNDPMQPKGRQRWTDEEVDALMKYIEELGCSWALIKSTDDELDDSGEEDHESKLSRRSQVDLKDKARNMKMDYIKAGVTLPKNFEYISLGPKLKNKLVQGGFHYYGP
ncbi:hypothetical protein M501DRAFT_995190 [Patellaria atrata CBS 101060]|uniref:Myb-like domain-containing protein n=1 Tax=Patellaria atrata CBS 101060 TaxID=1346257 RepID=A0A9P4SAA0_9PEZI|nr:hypothetical protein M501DRAFT_995190 [Patellaria atrata CBS 101060]